MCGWFRVSSLRAILPPALPHMHAGLADAAAALLALADDNGLAHLRAVALDYCVHNFEAVAKTGVGGAGVAMKLG